MNLRQIYEKLRQQAERNGQEIDEGRLRQQAWMMRDRMMFEQSYVNSMNSLSPGSGGGRRRQQPISNSGELILYYEFDGSTFKYFVYNFETEFISEFKEFNVSGNWSSIKPITKGGFFVEINNDDNFNMFFISTSGEITWQDTTENTSDVDIENFSRYIAAYYLKGSIWKLVVFDKDSNIKSFDFENLIEGGGYSYDDVWSDGFVVREEVGSIYKFYIINMINGTATLFKQYDYFIDSLNVYQYAYSNKIVTLKNYSLIEVFNSSGQKLSEFNSLSEFNTQSWSLYDFSFLENDSFVIFGRDNDNGKYTIVFYSGISNTFSYKVVESNNYRYDIYDQKNYTDPSNWNAEGSSIFLFYNNSEEPDDIRYYDDAIILPIWSTDLQLRNFYNLSPNKGINDNLDDSDIAITRSADYINLLIDNDRDNDTNYSILRFNRVGDVTTLISTDIPKNLYLDDDDPIVGKTFLQFQRNFEKTGTWGWDDLSDVEDRFYYSLRSASNGNFRNLVNYPIDVVMKDIVNNQYWAIRFTDWQQGGGGGFAYTRQLIEDGVLTGDVITFTHSNWLFSEPDVIVPGVLELKRGEYGPIYNSAVEDESNNNNPSGTLWNSQYVYNNLYEYLHYIIGNDGTVIDSVITSQNYDNDYEGSTYILNDEIFGKTWVSNNQNGGQFQLLTEYYRSSEDNNNTSEETGLRLGNFIISNGFRSRIVTENSISNIINVPKNGDFINKVQERDIFHNGCWVLTFDDINANFYFYNINGQLVGQKVISGSDWNWYSSYNYGKRSTIILEINDKKQIILFNGITIKEIESDYSNVSINDYYWWWD